MSVTVETIQRVLRSWIAIEVLTPQITKDGGWNNVASDRGGRQRNRHTDLEDGLTPWRPPRDDDPPPWPILPDVPCQKAAELTPAASDVPGSATEAAEAGRKERAWYSIVLGALPAKEALLRLDSLFRDETDEDQVDRKMTGQVIAASVVLDERGIMVPDSLAVSSFAWGVGHMLRGGTPDALSAWGDQELSIKARISDLLRPVGTGGHHRSLTWRDLRGASQELASEFGIPDEFWIMAPCAIEIIRRDPPDADILSSFFLPDLGRVLRTADHLPAAAASYLGLTPPTDTWDALTNREKLSDLLQPELFPLARWPGPGLHPLTLLQQAAVNAIARDLEHEGLAAVNGPPGTGKTTMLRDLVAHVLVSRAEKLAAIEKPANGVGDLDLISFAIVVASSNNAAVENVTLELPVRAKALDRSVWHDSGLDYFPHTATALLDLPANAPAEERAWGLIAARLGRAENRRRFFQRAWWDKDWGLNDWLNQVAWPDAAHNRDRPPGKLAELEAPPRAVEAMAQWRWARAEFRRVLEHCRRLRSELAEVARQGASLRCTETRIPAARARKEATRLDYDSARKIVAARREEATSLRAQVATETAKLSALAGIRPSPIARLLRTSTWRSHEASIRTQMAHIEDIQEKLTVLERLLAISIAEEQSHASAHREADHELDELQARAVDLGERLKAASLDLGASVPDPGFWALSDEIFHQASPWNHGRFRAARDKLFAAAICVHRAFIVAGARALKPSLNTIAKAAMGGPDAPKPTAQDWGIFFLLVPVTSTTFASIGRMFQTLGPREIGWLLIDEAGQASPQQAVGAVWRARRAVVIGDPLQIEPVATTPERTTNLICEANNVRSSCWTAPRVSAQTLADRASSIQGHFPVQNTTSSMETRITGMPLLVHRRCERPMFNLANQIAYAGRMIYATSEGSSAIRDILGDTAWIHVDAPSADKWVEEEGLLIARAIAELSARLPALPDLYVISPFRLPAVRLRQLLLRRPGIFSNRAATEREDWVKRRVGTVHTFQGKEAECVILMLGAGRGARPGSRNWAGGTPNLLNVAATRAKRSLYIVGNRHEWSGAGVFSDAAHMLRVRQPEEWLNASSIPSTTV